MPAPVAQGLVYPALDARLDSPSIQEGAPMASSSHDPAWRPTGRTTCPIRRYWEDWRASPVLAEDKRGVAPALVVTAGFDPLRDEGAAYARDLADVDVDVEYRCYDDMVHGFFGMGVVPDCLALATEVCDAMGALMLRATAPLQADGRRPPAPYPGPEGVGRERAASTLRAWTRHPASWPW